MHHPHPTDPLGRKHVVRAEAHNLRRRQENRDLLSRRIFERLAALPEYHWARTVLSYVSFGSEVSTREFLSTMWASGKRLVIPYCVGTRLDLFCPEGFEDLAPGTWGILEPRPPLRGCVERHTHVDRLDMVVVPGLAFDDRCGRVGYGKGYFDRLLSSARPDTALVAVAFQCQIFAEVPVLPSDVRVDSVLTESALYRRSQPRLIGSV